MLSIRPSRGHNVPTEFLISIFAEFLHIFCTTKNLNLGIQDPNFSFKWLVVVYRIIFYPRLLQFLLLECQKFQCFVGGHIVPPPRLSRNSEMLGLIGLSEYLKLFMATIVDNLKQLFLSILCNYLRLSETILS